VFPANNRAWSPKVVTSVSQSSLKVARSQSQK